MASILLIYVYIYLYLEILYIVTVSYIYAVIKYWPEERYGLCHGDLLYCDALVNRCGTWVDSKRL